MMEWITAAGLIASALTTIAYIPEVVKTVRKKHTRDLSLSWIAMLIVGQIFWLIYGEAIVSYPLIITALASIIMMTIMMVCKLDYRNR